MAYGLDVPIIIAAAVALAIGTVVALIMLLRGPAKKPAGRGGKDTKKSSSSSTTPTKKPTAPKKDSSKKVATTPKKAATPKSEKKKSEKDNKKATAAKPAKVEKPTASETSAVLPESPKVEPVGMSKTEKKKQAKRAAKAAAAAAVPVHEETSAEDIEFARTMSNNAKGVSGKKKEVEAEEVEETAQQGTSRNWAEINAKNSEVQKYKAKVKENEKEIADLRRIIEENKKKMREYNLTNAKLVTDRNTQKEQYEEKIARLKADIEARRDNRDVVVKGGDALRDRNYVVNVLQQERDSYKNQLDAVSLEKNKIYKALQEAQQAQTAAIDALQAERVNVARLTALLEGGSSSGKEHVAAPVEDTNGKEGDEQAST